MSTPWRTRAVATAGATALAISLAAPAGADGNPNTSEKLQEAVEVDAVVEHLESLEDLAYEHEETGFRSSGTPGYEAASQYVEDELTEAGLEVERQEFEFPYFQLNSAEFAQVSPESVTYAQDEDYIPMSFSGAGEAEAPVEAVDVNLDAPADNDSGCEPEDFEGFTEGNVALIQRGACAFGVKAANAGAAGASGVIIFNTAPGDEVFAGTLGEPMEDAPPTVGTGHDLGVELMDADATVRLAIDAESEMRETWNVIAETTQGRDDNVVMLGAHLDGVTEGPGVNDNGTGTAGILEVAKQVADVNKLNNKLRFAFWGAEEFGLHGSWHYIEDLAANDPDALEDIAGYLNFDMIGSPNHMIGVYDADESTYEAPVPVPDGSAELESVFTDHFDRDDQPWVDTEFSGRSDYQAFIAAGVASSGLFTGADGVKTEEEVEWFGGTAGEIYDPNYHTAEDDLDNVNVEALDTMTDAIAHAAITLGYDTSALDGDRAPGRSGCAGGSCDAPGLQAPEEEATPEGQEAA